MKEQEVLEAIQLLRKYNSETSKVEVKTASGGFPKKCYDTISAFANKDGGIILFGINEEKNFQTEGVYDVNDLQKQISSLCNDAMEPAIRVSTLPLEFEGKNILAVKVDEISQNQKPCYYKSKGMKNGSYIRVGDQDEVMTDYEIYAIQSYNAHIIEDIRPNVRAKISDLREEDLKKYILKLQLDKPNFSKNDYIENLKSCGIVTEIDGKVMPTVAGTFLFGFYPQSFYPQMFIACVVIPGTELGCVGENGERFIDNKRVEGTIEEMLDGAMNFLRRNMRVRVTIDANGVRTNKSEYPIDALREAIVNALVHRDYSFQKERAYISLYMYTDRVEIVSPGGLYGGISLEKLEKTSILESRNPTIIKILEEKGDVVENRHTGISTMKNEMKKHGLPEPEFYEEISYFKVVFRNNMSINYISSEQVSDTQSGHESGHESGHQNLDIETYKNKILQYCTQPKTAKEIREFLQMKSRQYVSAKIIQPLIKYGKLEYTEKKNIKSKAQRYVTKKDK